LPGITSFSKEITYLSPGPVISGQPDIVQNSEMVPYTRLIWSKNAIAERTNQNSLQKTGFKYSDCRKRGGVSSSEYRKHSST
jgi:hypothetical protein